MFKVITILMSIMCSYEDETDDYIDYCLSVHAAHPRFGLHGRNRARTCTPSPHIEILGEECLLLDRRHSF